MEPDISKDDQQIASPTEEINELKGNPEDDDLKFFIDAYQSEKAQRKSQQHHQNSPNYSRL